MKALSGLKRSSVFTALAVLLLSGARLNSQTAPPAQTPEQLLNAVRAANQALLERQKATLLRLETMQKEAEQLRIFVKRG